MDYVVAVLLGAITALLIAILVEMGRIRLSLDPRAESVHSAPEPGEGRQMVTVNVGAVGAPELNPVKVEQAPVVVEAPVSLVLPTEEISPEPAPEPAPKSRSAIFSSSPKPGSGTLGAIKCPHCGSENSSFRTECFQCGKGL